jgi:predicted alpha/beta-fold hydrolase
MIAAMGGRGGAGVASGPAGGGVAAGPFVPPWWARNPHVQTIWGPLLRRGGRVALRRERHETADGDFVDLDWDAAGPRPGTAPVLLALHGLEGSSASHYAGGLLAEARARGWRAGILQFRSCSGEINRRPRFYHSGDWADLETVVARLAARDPGQPLALVGVSLGGNVLLKWLGERAGAVPPEVVGAVAISTPFDVAACARVLDRGFARVVYAAHFLRTMRRKVVAKARFHPGFVDVAAARRARTFAAYDEVVTAPLEGFAGALDYWTRASSGPWLRAIRRPALLLNALDDPLVPVASLPAPGDLPQGVVAEFPARGGHAGFLEGPPWRVRSWAERRAVEFLTARLAPAAPEDRGEAGRDAGRRRGNAGGRPGRVAPAAAGARRGPA